MSVSSVNERGQLVLFIGGPEVNKVHWVSERAIAEGHVVLASKKTREFESRKVVYRVVKVKLGSTLRVCFAPDDMSKDSVQAAVTSYLARAYDNMLKGILDA